MNKTIEKLLFKVPFMYYFLFVSLVIGMAWIWNSTLKEIATVTLLILLASVAFARIIVPEKLREKEEKK